ncbi:hypothetical protein LPJ72_000236 [Coemansia sp. Benny D160-2]|nr:hypothetical protein LPJ72_000236 [Coemansia sp. Benny D160-2]
MVSFSTCVASIMALATAVNAGFYTTYPVGADSVSSGQTINITWRPDEQEPLLDGVSGYTLKFMTGGNIVQTTVATIGDFDISKQEISFTIPSTAPGMYFLMYTASNGAGSSWSTRFSVNGGTTWYPDGVATGVDPGTSSTSSGGINIGTPTQITASEPETSASPTKSTPAPSNSSSDEKDSNSTPAQQTASEAESSPEKSAEYSSSLTTDSSDSSDNGDSSNGNGSGDGSGNGNSNSDAKDTSNAAEHDSDSANMDEADVSDDHVSEEDESSNEESDSAESMDDLSDDTESSGASAIGFVSVVAAAVAATFALLV